MCIRDSMYNGGVKLACTGSSSLDDLRALAEAGVEIMSCGTCLNHYGLACLLYTSSG